MAHPEKNKVIEVAAMDEALLAEVVEWMWKNVPQAFLTKIVKEGSVLYEDA
jgi:hypothetical protein